MLKKILSIFRIKYLETLVTLFELRKLEAVTRVCTVKNVFLNISQNSQEMGNWRCDRLKLKQKNIEDFYNHVYMRAFTPRRSMWVTSSYF